MTDSTARLEIVPIWERLNDQLIRLVDFVPEDRLDWSPTPELWSFRHLFQHLNDAREEWMTRAINDGEGGIGVYQNVHSKAQIQDAFRRTWQRIERSIGEQAKLDATYRDRWWAEAPIRTGHWVAFHLLEHDIHHRADMLLYLSLLGLEVPSEWTQTL